MKMLIVDDEPAAIRSLERVIKKVLPDAEVISTDVAEDAIPLVRENEISVAFLDVEMPDLDGLTLAKEVKNISPVTNVVFVTAYSKYAMEAFGQYPSGYLLKPVTAETLKEALTHLRNPLPKYSDGLYARCFGNFEVFFNGEPLKFKRSQSKEVLAYLVDRKGASVSSDELCSILWEDSDMTPEQQRNYFYHVFRDLRKSLEEVGCEDLLIGSRGTYAIVPEKLRCDYYLYEAGEELRTGPFKGEYMSQYSWAEYRIGEIAGI